MNKRCLGIGIGTCIIGVLTSEEFIVGADSLRSYEDREPEYIPKIVQVRNSFFISSGISLHGDTKFNIQSLCRTALRKGKTINESIRILEKIVRKPLRRVYEHAAQEDRANYESVVKKNPVNVAFFGVENGTLLLSQRKFLPEDFGDKVLVSLQKADFIGDNSNQGSVCLGCEEVFNNSWSPTRPDPYRDPVGFVKYVISWAEKNESVYFNDGQKRIGGPIDIIRITKEKAEWIQKKSICPPIRNPK